MAKIAITISVEESLVARMDTVAKAAGVSRSWLTSKVMGRWVEENFSAEEFSGVPQALREQRRADGARRRNGERKVAVQAHP